MEDTIRKLTEVRFAGLFVYIWSFFGGILLASFFFIFPLSSVFVMCVGGAGVCISYFTHNKLLFLVGVFLIGIGSGMLRFAVKDFHTESILESKVGKTVILEGVVQDEPERRDNDVRVKVKTSEGVLLITTDQFVHVSYGDEVRVEGKLKKPGVITSDTGRDFDYGAYLSKDEVYYTMSFARMEVLSYGHANPVRRWLLFIKQKFVERIQREFPEPESSLLSGLLISGKEALPPNILNEFKRAGVVHIVVLSGYNITIIAEFLALVFGYISLTVSLYASVIGILLFVLLTGGGAPVVRAAIMALILVVGKFIRRPYSASRALLVTVFFMLLINPKLLVFDPSFQLSFLAVLALLYVEPVVKRGLHKIPEKFGFRSTLSTTLAAQITVFPFLLYSMGTVSLIAPVSNLLILLFIPYTMLLGFIAVVLSFLSSLLAFPIAYISHLLLSYILNVTHIFSNLPFANIQIPQVNAWSIDVLYVILGGIIWRFRNFSQQNSN